MASLAALNIDLLAARLPASGAQPSVFDILLLDKFSTLLKPAFDYAFRDVFLPSFPNVSGLSEWREEIWLIILANVQQTYLSGSTASSVLGGWLARGPDSAQAGLRSSAAPAQAGPSATLEENMQGWARVPVGTLAAPAANNAADSRGGPGSVKGDSGCRLCRRSIGVSVLFTVILPYFRAKALGWSQRRSAEISSRRLQSRRRHGDNDSAGDGEGGARHPIAVGGDRDRAGGSAVVDDDVDDDDDASWMAADYEAFYGVPYPGNVRNDHRTDSVGSTTRGPGAAAGSDRAASTSASQSAPGQLDANGAAPLSSISPLASLLRLLGTISSLAVGTSSSDAPRASSGTSPSTAASHPAAATTNQLRGFGLVSFLQRLLLNIQASRSLPARTLVLDAAAMSYPYLHAGYDIVSLCYLVAYSFGLTLFATPGLHAAGCVLVAKGLVEGRLQADAAARASAAVAAAAAAPVGVAGSPGGAMPAATSATARGRSIARAEILTAFTTSVKVSFVVALIALKIAQWWTAPTADNSNGRDDGGGVAAADATGRSSRRLPGRPAARSWKVVPPPPPPPDAVRTGYIHHSAAAASPVAAATAASGAHVAGSLTPSAKDRGTGVNSSDVNLHRPGQRQLQVDQLGRIPGVDFAPRSSSGFPAGHRTTQAFDGDVAVSAIAAPADGPAAVAVDGGTTAVSSPSRTGSARCPVCKTSFSAAAAAAAAAGATAGVPVAAPSGIVYCEDCIMKSQAHQVSSYSYGSDDERATAPSPELEHPRAQNASEGTSGMLLCPVTGVVFHASRLRRLYEQ